MPYFPQLDNSVYCVPTSIKMIVEYYREYYGSGRYQSQIPDLSVEDIAGILKTRPNLGTTFRAEHGQNLTDALGILKVEFQKKQYDHDGLIDSFSRERPIIVWFDGNMAYYHNRRGEGGGHAAVMVAIDGQSIILNDPQVGPLHSMSINDFMPAWDTLDRKVISFEIIPTTQQKFDDSSCLPLEKNIKEEVGTGDVQR